jgi:catechol 2,3-dioxygenase-like lactoylglutathione lyase family enzyme
MPTLTQTIPALPVRSVAQAVGFYRDRLGFETLHHDGGFAVVRRDGVSDTDFGTREFSALDLDGNLFGFFRWVDE